MAACSEATSDDTLYDYIEYSIRNEVIISNYGSTIGGNDIKSTYVDVTDIDLISDTQWDVSGVVTLTDEFNTKWKNTFRCTVEEVSEDDYEVVGSLDYTSTSWTKTN